MAATEVLEVYLEGKPCGIVEKSDSGNLTFKYDSSYPVDATPLSLSMPVEVGSFPKRNILAYMENLLPDNPNALKALAQRFSVSSHSTFELIKNVGRDVSGAAQFIPEGEELAPPNEGGLKKLTQTEIAKLINEKKSEYQQGTPVTGITGVFSAAGMQAKILLHKGEDGWSSPNNHKASTHIIKPIPSEFPYLDLNEYVTQAAAGKLGLQVARTSIEEFGGISCLVSERYDRKFDPQGSTVRLHQEDLCQALATAPGKKYQRVDGGPGVAAVAALFKKVPNLEDREQLQMRFFDALVFNSLARCSDAHAKNYSVLLSGSRVSLAPLYDLNTGVTISDYDQASMSIDGEYYFSKMSSSGLIKEAKKLGLETDYANSVVARIKSGLHKAFLSSLDDLDELVPTTSRVKEFKQLLLTNIGAFKANS